MIHNGWEYLSEGAERLSSFFTSPGLFKFEHRYQPFLEHTGYLEEHQHFPVIFFWAAVVHAPGTQASP